MATGFKDAKMRGLGGALDTRAQPDEVGIANFRVLLNASTRARSKKARRGGWQRLYAGVNEEYNNDDLHDQLLSLSFYYAENSQLITIPGGFSGEYSYPYWQPPVDIPAFTTVTEVGEVCGYAPDYFGTYDYPIEEGYGIMADYFLGYPYALEVDTTPEDGCNTGEPDFYLNSSFTLAYAERNPGVSSDGYFWGDPTAVYNEQQSYLYEYCGNYPYAHATCKETITYLGSIGSANGTRTLVAGTKSRLYALNQSFGNWRVIADGLGSTLRETDDCDDCSSERFMSASLDNVLVLTNGVNRVLAYNPISQPTTCKVWRATEIDDLITLNVLTAGCVGSWKTFVFLGNVYQDGAQRRNRLLWSNSGDAYTWIPADNSLAGYQDLEQDETILRVEGLNDYLFIFTDQRIYRGALIQSAQEATFVFEEVYSGQDALKYKYSLVNVGDAIYYWSEDRLLKFTSFDKRPQELSWMRASSNAVFDGLQSDELTFDEFNEDACEAFIGGYNAQYKELWFSWPTGDENCPSMSLVYNLTTNEEGADFVDAGFTAFHWFEGRRTSTLIEWLEELEACARESLLGETIKEGDPVDLVSDAFTDPIQSIWNATEDTDLPSDSDSLCARVQNSWIRDVCKPCDALARFVMAAAADKALKEYTDTQYYREHLSSSVYVLDGYDTVIESGLDDFKFDEEKVINELRVTFTATAQTTPNLLYGYVGYGPAPDCITWEQLRFYDEDSCDTLLEGVALECLTDKTAQEHADDWTRPDDSAAFPTEVRGKFIGYRLKIEGTGGGSSFSKVALSVSKVG